MCHRSTTIKQYMQYQYLHLFRFNRGKSLCPQVQDMRMNNLYSLTKSLPFLSSLRLCGEMCAGNLIHFSPVRMKNGTNSIFPSYTLVGFLTHFLVETMVGF